MTHGVECEGLSAEPGPRSRVPEGRAKWPGIRFRGNRCQIDEDFGRVSNRLDPGVWSSEVQKFLDSWSLNSVSAKRLKQLCDLLILDGLEPGQSGPFHVLRHVVNEETFVW